MTCCFFFLYKILWAKHDSSLQAGISHHLHRGRRHRRPAQKIVLELRSSLYWCYTEIIVLQLLQNKDSSPITSVQNDIVLVCIFSRLRRGGVQPPVLQADDIRLYRLCTLFPGGGWNPAPTRLVYSTVPVGDGTLDVPSYTNISNKKDSLPAVFLYLIISAHRHNGRFRAVLSVL